MIFNAGDIFTAAAINGALNDIVDPGWVTYTPAWTATSGNPAIGNGTISGRYRRVASPVGDMVEAEVILTMGGSTTYGTGAWRISLPVTAHAAAVTMRTVGSATALDQGTSYRSAASYLVDSTHMAMVTAVAAGEWSAAVPQTWVSTDQATLRLRYQAA